MLKKQTVWLLTMLSLMIVLSVYYMTSPDDMGDQAFINKGQDQADDVVNSDKAGTKDDAKVDNISNADQDELYTMLRMDIEDERSMKKGRLETVVASSSSSAEQISEALKKMDVIEQRSTNEVMLEKKILAEDEFKDVLVQSDQDKVQVNIKVKEKLTKQKVVQIMQKTQDEFGNIRVNVNQELTTK